MRSAGADALLEATVLHAALLPACRHELLEERSFDDALDRHRASIERRLALRELANEIPHLCGARGPTRRIEGTGPAAREDETLRAHVEATVRDGLARDLGLGDVVGEAIDLREPHHRGVLEERARGLLDHVGGAAVAV